MLGIVNFQIRLPRPHLRSINDGTPPQQRGPKRRPKFFDILASIGAVSAEALSTAMLYEHCPIAEKAMGSGWDEYTSEGTIEILLKPMPA